MEARCVARLAACMLALGCGGGAPGGSPGPGDVTDAVEAATETAAGTPDDADAAVTDGTPAQDVPSEALPADLPPPSCSIAIADAGLDASDPLDVKLLAELTLVPPQDPAIVSWSWKLAAAPDDNQACFVPSAYAASPEFDVDVVGDYSFELTVQDAAGQTATCTRDVTVPPPQGCLVELTWNTPTDTNRCDTCEPQKDCGSDMDLHFVHPYAAGPDLDGDGQPDGYFDENWDVFWFHANPIWDATHGSNPAFQPALLREDTDGWGPELIDYPIPPTGLCYKVGVHYWDDHGLGQSWPTVEIWANGQRIYTRMLAVGMKTLDLWEVGSVCCADGTFTEFTDPKTPGQPWLVPNYRQTLP